MEKKKIGESLAGAWQKATDAAKLPEEAVTADIFEIETKPNDKLLLCSDGLTNMVEDYEIKTIVQSSDDIESAVHRLIDQANENGGKDNISVVLVEPGVMRCNND